MTTLLISPANNQPCEFVASERGFVALRCDYISPQVRWFPIEAIEAVNPVCCYPQPLTFVLLPEMVGTISHAIGVTLVYPQPPDDAYVVKPAPITVYHDSMRAA